MDISKEMKDAGFVYREPCKVDKDSPEYLKQKYELAKKYAQKLLL